MTSIPGNQVTGTVASATNASTLNGQSSSDIISAASDEVRAPISSLPFTINSPGSYYLTDNLTYSSSTGNAITVNVNNVTIDFNGFAITGPGNSFGTPNGVWMNYRSNVEIKNGTITQFGAYGILEGGGTGVGNRIINMRIVDNGSASFDGIYLLSPASLVRDCSVGKNGRYGIYVATGSVVTGNTAYKNKSDGIVAAFGGSTVAGNATYLNDGNGITAAVGATVKNNTASNNGYYGINLSGSNLVDGNTAVDNDTAGGYGDMTTCGTCVFGDNVPQL